MKKDSMTLNIHNTKHFEHCLKEEIFESAQIYDVDFNKIGLVGKIVIAEPKEKELRWHSFLNSLTHTDIPRLTNKTNKAILLIKRKNYVFSVSYGYGYAMIEDTTVVKDFGMKVTANMVSEKQIKSTNSFNFQDTPFNIQRQVQGFSGIEVFQNGSYTEILKSISGVPVDKETFSFTTGSDSLKVSINFVDNSIKDALDRIIGYYESDSYKEKGMDWIDNIRLVKDKIVIADLDNALVQKIKSNPSKIVIDTNRLHNWQEVGGFRITGMGARRRKGEGHEYMFEIPSLEYFKFLNERDLDNVSFLKKLKRDTLNYNNTQIDGDFKICNIYSALTGEITHNSNKYFIYDGSWYKLSEDFYNETITKIREIPIVGLDFRFPVCNFEEPEGDYNLRITKANKDLFLFDKKLYQRPEFGRSKIEIADIISRDKKVIHVKKGGGSALLSHLFSQVLVSSELLKGDAKTLDFVNDIVKHDFGEEFLKAPGEECEIIIAIIHKNYSSSLEKILPFFSMISLLFTCEKLSLYGYKYRVALIEQLDQ